MVTIKVTCDRCGRTHEFKPIIMIDGWHADSRKTVVYDRDRDEYATTTLSSVQDRMRDWWFILHPSHVNLCPECTAAVESELLDSKTRLDEAGKRYTEEFDRMCSSVLANGPSFGE